MVYYNRTNTCYKCGRKLAPGKPAYPRREYDEKGDWTGRWLCIVCYGKDYRCRPDSLDNMKKSVGDRRTGNLDPNSNCAKGDLFEELTCRWRGVKNLNAENDDYRSPIDHSRDHELGIIQTKGRLYDHISMLWNFTRLEIDHNKNFDNIICYCASKEGKKIERIYVFPKSEIIKRKCIAIMKNPMNTRGTRSIIPWYEKYRIIDEETIKKVN